MQLAIVGTGYVGLVTGACFAEIGHTVYCVDKDVSKIKQLKRGKIPIFEPGLEDMVLSNQKKGRLHFSTDLSKVLNQVEAVFLAVGTPPNKDHSADLSAVVAVSKEIGRHLKKETVVVTKSTVPVGTSELVRGTIKASLTTDVSFAVASNPEFLREGAAVRDFLEPDRIVVGVDDPKAEATLREVYRYFIQNDRPFLVTSIPSAEVIKYASNAFLATKISFINEVANFCEEVGASIADVSNGMGLDSRIGAKYLHAGLGYGGSCFPKDVKALIASGQKQGRRFQLLEAVEAVNQVQRFRIVEKLKKHLGNLKGKRIAVWGLAFKAKTDDTREAPSLTIIAALIKEGAEVIAFDPVVKQVPSGAQRSTSQYAACQTADALVVLTEWEDFLYPDFARLKKDLRQPLIVDGRNLYRGQALKDEGFIYECIGESL